MSDEDAGVVRLHVHRVQVCIFYFLKIHFVGKRWCVFLCTLCVVRTGDGGVDARILVQVRPWDGDGGLEVTAADVGQTWFFFFLNAFLNNFSTVFGSYLTPNSLAIGAFSGRIALLQVLEIKTI